MASPDDRWTRAMRRGDYERAWSVCAEALAARDPRTRDDPDKPYHLRWVWDGTPVDGRHVLVRCYHGLGDTVQFARYLPLLAQRAASVTLEGPERLASLLQQLPGVDRFIPFDPARPAAPSECDLEIMDLAFALRTAPTKLPPPYLHAAPAPLPEGTIALCYEAGEWDPARSVPPALLTELCRERPCLSLVPGATDLPVLNPEGCPFDMALTASWIAGAELIITVDTMIAHLAGAMNKPTWLLLKHDPDWRWPPDSERSDWYPSMRLYAQESPGAWSGVIDRVLADLRAAAPVPMEEFAQ
jgi:hypothetical protein